MEMRSGQAVVSPKGAESTGDNFTFFFSVTGKSLAVLPRRRLRFFSARNRNENKENKYTIEFGVYISTAVLTTFQIEI